MRPLVLYGAGGLGREVALLVRALGSWDVLGYIDDGAAARGALGLELLGGFSRLAELAAARSDLAVALCVGHSDVRARLAARLDREAPGAELVNLIHPDATVDAAAVSMGRGNLIAAGARLANVSLGACNVINMNTVLGHDVSVGDYTLVHPGAVINGEVAIGSRVTIGAGAVLMPRIRVGDGAVVAIGAVAGQDVRAGDVVAGNPARVVRRGDDD